MLPVASLITYRALFCLISFAIKTVAVSPKKKFAAYFDAQMAALKLGIWNQETESRKGIRNQISMIEKYYIKIP